MYLKDLRDVEVTIRDFDLLRRIKPETIVTYLEAYDWSRVDRDYGGLVSYAKRYLGVDATVTFPTSADFTYYPQYVQALINQVATVDGRSVLRTLEILAGNLLCRHEES